MPSVTAPALPIDPAVLAGLSDEALAALVADLPEEAARHMLGQLGSDAEAVPPTPLGQAQALDPMFSPRPHLRYLSDRIAAAVADVERGHSRRLIVEMPPRMGKTTTSTIYTPLWVLRKHPDWPIALISHDSPLATSWGRAIRRAIEEHPLGLAIAPDAGAVSEWETTQRGSVVSRSIGGSLTGRGAKLLVVDDPHKDFATAHSEEHRNSVWNWWLTVAQLRLQPPTLVIVIMTRWHEDDLVGRLLSPEHEGDPADWEVIRLPALADDPNDPLGRAEGEPLLSPLIPAETAAEATARWKQVRTSIGSYAWAALMQQRPSPARGAIFDMGWWRYWTDDPALASRDEAGRLDPDGRVVYLDPSRYLTGGGRWLDSWDMAFKDKDSSDYVVGQRWLAVGASRYLIHQFRGRLSFTGTLAEVQDWADPGGSTPHARAVGERLVEDKANGTAVISTLRASVSGIIPINPTDSKVGRARAESPTVEAGNVLLPYPTADRNQWVQTEFLPEFREFPNGAHDDQVDAATQALYRLRSPGTGSVHVPGRSGRRIDRSTAAMRRINGLGRSASGTAGGARRRGR